MYSLYTPNTNQIQSTESNNIKTIIIVIKKNAIYSSIWLLQNFTYMIIIFFF